MTAPVTGRLPDAARARPAPDWFVLRERDGLVECVAWAPAERLVRAALVLLEQFDPAVDVTLESARTGRVWSGALRALGDVRLALAGLQRPLATDAGVEVSVCTPDEQLTLTPSLLLVIVARSGRWSYLLEAHGFVLRERIPAPDWDPAASLRRPAPELEAALEAVAAELGLVAGDGPG